MRCCVSPRGRRSRGGERDGLAAPYGSRRLLRNPEEKLGLLLPRQEGRGRVSIAEPASL